MAICEACQVNFTPKPRSQGTYCSHACRNIALRSMRSGMRAAWPERICEQCRSPFKNPTWRGRGRFCSAACWYAYRSKKRLRPPGRKRRLRVCQVCGASISTDRRFCSDPCRASASKRKTPRMQTCEVCTSLFAPKPHTAGRFCSWHCYAGQRTAQAKGSRKINRQGYILISAGRSRWVYEHRLIMEKALGRPLAKDEVVDHINGVRHDNQVENLRVMTKREHAKMHSALYKNPPHFPKPRLGRRPDKRTGRFEPVPIGQKCLNADGYVQVKTPYGWCLEHRLIAAEMMGRAIGSDEHVHHLDGNKANNDPQNLVVLKASEHIRIAAPHEFALIRGPRSRKQVS